MSDQPAEEGQHPSVKAKLNYLLFIILTAVAVFSVSRLSIFIPLLESVTTKLTLFIASLVGLSATYNNTLLTVDGFRMSFIAECTALHFILLFFFAVLFTPDQKAGHRIIGIMGGMPTIIFINSARLVLLGFIGSRTTRQTFDSIHDFIFQIMMAILVLAMWLFWSEQGLANSKKTNYFIKVITFSVLYLLLASTIGDTYLSIMAYASSKIFTTVGFADMAAAVMKGTFSYLIKWERYSISYRQDVVSLVLLWGLFSASVWQEMAAQTKDIKHLLKWVTAGTIILMALQLAECVGVGVLLREGVSAATVEECLLYLRFLFIGLPIAIWRYSERQSIPRGSTATPWRKPSAFVPDADSGRSAEKTMACEAPPRPASADGA